MTNDRTSETCSVYVSLSSLENADPLTRKTDNISKCDETTSFCAGSFDARIWHRYQRCISFVFSGHQIPSRPMSTAPNSTVTPYPTNQTGPAQVGPPPMLPQQPNIRSLPPTAPNTTNINSTFLPASTFASTIPPPPPISALHLHPSPLSQIPLPAYQQPFLLSSLSSMPATTVGSHLSHGPAHRPEIVMSSDPSAFQQQVPMPATHPSMPVVFPTQAQQATSAFGNAPASLMGSLPATDSALASRSDNCPECRAIT